ncbi:hypothetical protein ASPACDRAFT_37493, partial [Aspergillus aculeatus ATCC 16872]
EKTTLINYINKEYLLKINKNKPIIYFYLFYKNKIYSSTLELRYYFYNIYLIKKPRRNCISRK